MNTANKTLLEPGSLDALAGKYLTFTLGGESYGIGVMKVREIIRPMAITFVPQMPDYVKGVINLRGKVIPIVDLRLKFKFRDVRDTQFTCVVVVKVVMNSGTETLMGLVVDGVEEVANITVGEIEPTPDFGGSLDTAYVLGMAKLKGGVKTLLDIDKLLNAENVTPLIQGG